MCFDKLNSTGLTATRQAFYRVGLITVLWFMWVSIQPASAQSLQNGDYLVGALDGGYGIIWRLRDGEKSAYCVSDDPRNASPDSPVAAWGNPYQVMIDQEDRVVFLANVAVSTEQEPGLLPPGIHGFGLFRCNAMGERPEVLALFPTDPLPEPSQARGPVPFPGETFAYQGGDAGSGHEGGLHLALHPAMTIDDRENNGTPQFGTEEVYVFGVADWDPDARSRTGVRILEYWPRTAEFKDGPATVESTTDAGEPRYKIPDMVFDAGATYSAVESIIGRYREPL
ncbi:MAG: hypothetical protein D6743_19020, partial [Calditrichaeota bacterium]